MKAITEDFITDLSVRECSAAFRVGAEASYGGMRKFASLVTKMQDRASAQFSFFTPRPDEVFGDLDEDPPTWSGGVTVPGVTKVNGTLEMVVQIYVWERGSHREVQIIAPYGIGEKGSTSRVLDRILQEFPATSPTDAPETPQEPTPISAPVAMATHRADAASMVVPATAGAVTFHTGPVQQPTQAPVAAKQPPLAAPRATATSGVSAAAASGKAATRRSPALLWGAVAVAAVLIIGGLAVVAVKGNTGTPTQATALSGTTNDSVGESEPDLSAGSDQPLGVSGEWVGVMYGTSSNYRFDLTLTESSNGSVSGRMTQTQLEKSGTPTGLSGVEKLEGTRQGNRLVLEGVSWSRSSPDDWYLDTIKVRVAPNEESFEGTYTCAVCDVHPIRGERS